MKENLIKNEYDGCQSMSIDVLCVKQGLEYNYEGLKVLEVYNSSNENNYDALIHINNKDILIENIKVDDRYIYFKNEYLDNLEKECEEDYENFEKSLKIWKGIADKRDKTVVELKIEIFAKMEIAMQEYLNNTIGKFANVNDLDFGNAKTFMVKE